MRVLSSPIAAAKRRLALAFFVLSAGCAVVPEPLGSLRPETVYAVTDRAELIQFNAGQPQRVLQRLPLQGLPAGDRLVGIDFRIARGVLYAMAASGRLYTLDTIQARLTAVGSGAPISLNGERFGVDFNPVADRLRVVSDTGQNLRFHPDTGALAAADAPLASSTAGGAAPRVAAAAYTYNKRDEKLTTNFAIELGTGWLVRQGSSEGTQPVVSPNSGQITPIGPLGTGAAEDVSFDIADTDNTALAAVRAGGRTRLHRVDLVTGRATLLGTVAEGRPLWGMAIAP